MNRTPEPYSKQFSFFVEFYEKTSPSMPPKLSLDFNFNVQLIFPTRYLPPCWPEGWWGGEVPQILPVGMLCPLPPGSILLHPKVHLEGLRRWKDQDACSRTSGWLNKTRDLGTVLFIPYPCKFCTCTYFCNTTFLIFKSVDIQEAFKSWLNFVI